MNILDGLYTLTIGPLKLLFEVIFTLAYYLTNNVGISIVVLSLIMNILLLPLYNKADKIQDEENAIEKKLKPGVDHIKKSFKGDERYMILQTYYRQNNYKQTSVLKGSISLLLEIPFFIAAYSFLSNLNILHGASFSLISNLGEPDQIIKLFGLSINLLPILMTVVNIVSSAIYTKGQPLKSKLQLYLMALAFLVFLYNSPSGLVLYWTLNNVFSLVKNIVIKIKNSKTILSILSGVAGVAIALNFLVINPVNSIIQKLLFILISIVLLIPCLLLFIKVPKVSILDNFKLNNKLFFIGCVFLSLLTGLLIPSIVVNSSPSEFVDVFTLQNPTLYIINTLLLAFGTFVIWLGIFYVLLNEKIKKILCILIWAICFAAVVDYMFFGTNIGRLSNLLVYDDYFIFSGIEILINAAVVLAILVAIVMIYKYKSNILSLVAIAGIITMIIVSSMNLININRIANKTIEVYTNERNEQISFSFSKKNKNVIFIMMDRAISSYFPFLLEEKPELKEQFAGFTFYPNTLSYGCSTNVAASPVYGGYEYTPYEMNKRSNENLPDKKDEALKLLPIVFSNENYNVITCDPPFAGNSEVPDLSIFDDIENVKAYNTTTRFLTDDLASNITSLEKLNRNLFCYSITKIAPLAIQSSLYNAGMYNSIDDYVFRFSDGTSNMSGIHRGFASNYSVLRSLPSITEIGNSDNGTLLMLYNSTAHEDTLLQEPEYEPKENVDNTKYDKEHEIRQSIEGKELKLKTKRQYQHYEVNMASMMKLGDWFDYLREIGVYDNTKIIIVADHGCTKSLNQFNEMNMEFGVLDDDIMCYNPLLLVKDFDSKDFTIDYSFMTNADVPSLVVQGVIDNPINPFTGNEINMNDKENSTTYVIQDGGQPLTKGNTFISRYWYAVKDNIFDTNNWKLIEDTEIK